MTDRVSSELADEVSSLYSGPIELKELKNKLFYSSLEQPGPTPPRDEYIYEMVYSYIHSQQARLSPEQLALFAPSSGGGWICCGKEISKLLAVAPNTSLNDLMQFAKEKGYAAEAV